jgi:hypothetical protein
MFRKVLCKIGNAKNGRDRSPAQAISAVAAPMNSAPAAMLAPTESPMHRRPSHPQHVAASEKPKAHPRSASLKKLAASTART